MAIQSFIGLIGCHKCGDQKNADMALLRGITNIKFVIYSLKVNNPVILKEGSLLAPLKSGNKDLPPKRPGRQAVM